MGRTANLRYDILKILMSIKVTFSFNIANQCYCNLWTFHTWKSTPEAFKRVASSSVEMLARLASPSHPRESSSWMEVYHYDEEANKRRWKKTMRQNTRQRQQAINYRKNKTQKRNKNANKPFSFSKQSPCQVQTNRWQRGDILERRSKRRVW